MKSETLLLLFLLWIKDQVQCVPNFLPTCQTVSVPVCSELTLNNKPNAEESEVQQWRYNTTVYPSFADDKSDADAILKLSHLHPLIATKCSSFIKIFLCSVHAPVCTTSGVVPPCRELCERVRDNCSHVAQMFDLDWPEVLNCDVFPRFKPNWKCNSNAAKDGLLSSNSENFLVSRVTPIIWSEALLADGNVSKLTVGFNLSLPLYVDKSLYLCDSFFLEKYSCIYLCWASRYSKYFISLIYQTKLY